MTPTSIVVRHAADRFRTDADGITTFHSFSYGRHYDPENVGFGPVVALNEECIPPRGGYDLHRHADVTIHTLVLEGRLAHEDTDGRRYVLGPGELRSVSAGEGIEHSERNASTSEPLRFLQVIAREGPVAVAVLAFDEPGVRTITGAALVHVTHGKLTVHGHHLGPGDEARILSPGPYDVTASEPAGALIVEVR
jgi:hypothetical protein